MTTLIIGANGATGRLLVSELLARGQVVKVIVRTLEGLPEAARNHSNLSVIEASILDLSHTELIEHTQGCSAVISCLGHNLTLKGIFSAPRRLVADATRRMCVAICANEPAHPVKFVLMNTTGNSNRDLNEHISFGQKCVMSLLRMILPPHTDNEQAADYLRVYVGQNNPMIEWAAVRPDSLINEAKATEYDIQKSPTRSAIFDAGKTSRINVAHFMAQLTECYQTWEMWKGQMPVIYNKELL